MGTTSKGMVRSNEGCGPRQLSSSFIFEEIIYDIAVHTCSNESDNEASAVFMTLTGKVIETRKLLLQFPENTVHPLRSQQVDLFRFVDQDIGMVSARVPTVACSSRVDRLISAESDPILARRSRLPKELASRQGRSHTSASKQTLPVTAQSYGIDSTGSI